MKRSVGVLFTLLCLLTFTIPGCKKTDDGPYYAPADYFRAETGKYIIYQLDSTRFANYGQDKVVTSYQAKDVVENISTDLLGRPAYLIQRYLRGINSTSESDWHENIAYLITIDSSNTTLEVLENNLRYVKLQGPLRSGHTWLGNGYLPDDPFSVYEFSAAVNIPYWNYSIDESYETLDILGKTYDNVVTVTQIDDSSNVPILNKQMIAQKMKWTEQYAKNIGLISKEVILWEYQPEVNNADGYTTGFGIKLTILDHN